MKVISKNLLLVTVKNRRLSFFMRDIFLFSFASKKVCFLITLGTVVLLSASTSANTGKNSSAT